MSARNEIPALTGLRFVAAFVVLAAHVAFVLPNNLVTQFLVGLLLPGMVLFFVLSGFVMWLNYAQPIIDGQAGALRGFAIARFARLYPMYLVVILAALGAVFALDGWPHVKLILPDTLYFLAGIESWVPDYNGHLIVRGVLSISHLWSISAEAFLYLVFPLIALAMARSNRPKTIALTGLINLALGSAVFYVVLVHDQIIPGIAPRLTRADGWVWLTYFSPYLHLFEFIAGCAACHLYLTVRSRKPTKWASCSASVLGYAAAFSIFAVPVIQQILLTTKYPVACAMLVKIIPLMAFPFLIFFLVRYRSTLQAALSWQPIVAGGDISYSLYLLHPLVITGAYALTDHLQVFGMIRPFFFVAVTMLVSFLGSVVTYQWIELPAKTWIRGGRSATGRDQRSPRGRAQQPVPQAG
jgi:peptidoglycan/LPS O-acetylase OafA/YrhL